MARRVCACGCGEYVPEGSRRDRIYATKACAQRAFQRRRRRGQHQPRDGVRRSDAKPTEPQTREYVEPEDSRDGRASARRGPGYERFCKTEWPEKIVTGQAQPKDAMAALGESSGRISQWMAAYRIDREKRVLAKDWTRGEDVEDALLSYEPFVERFHPEVMIPDFHLEWEAEIDGAVGTGKRLCLLAPQRHGKTEFLIRYAQRRIAADPDICILWVSRAKELAEEAVGMLRQLLEEEEFAAAVLGPDGTFVPGARSGKSWTDEKFTVANRTRVRKSPTVRALGIGGTTSGRDADLIIVDDPQEREDCESPTTREKQYRWFITTLLARKTEKTGIALITSRRHPEDIPGKLAQDHEDWNILTYRAHDPTCPKPPHEFGEHDDCVLWPELRTFKFLMEKKADDPAFFECNYQNHPRASDRVLVTAEDIDRTKDPSRRMGVIPKGVTELIAGIDPAEAKPVAAVLWGYEPRGDEDFKRTGRRHLIDIMEAPPGVRGGREILRAWHERYRCTKFVVEKNIAQSWWLDTEIADFRSRNGIQLIEHYTDRTNKWDTKQGVTAMFELFRGDPAVVTLPDGDRESREIVNRLARSMLAFDPDHAGSKHADDDLVMAMWFPQPRMDGMRVMQTSRAQADYRQTGYVTRPTPYLSRPNRMVEVA